MKTKPFYEAYQEPDVSNPELLSTRQQENVEPWLLYLSLVVMLIILQCRTLLIRLGYIIRSVLYYACKIVQRFFTRSITYHI